MADAFNEYADICLSIKPDMKWVKNNDVAPSVSESHFVGCLHLSTGMRTPVVEVKCGQAVEVYTTTDSHVRMMRHPAVPPHHAYSGAISVNASGSFCPPDTGHRPMTKFRKQ